MCLLKNEPPVHYMIKVEIAVAGSLKIKQFVWRSLSWDDYFIVSEENHATSNRHCNNGTSTKRQGQPIHKIETERKTYKKANIQTSA